jgi:hypothetical protein
MSFLMHASLRSDVFIGVFGRKWVRVRVFDRSVGRFVLRGGRWRSAVLAGAWLRGGRPGEPAVVLLIGWAVGRGLVAQKHLGRRAFLRLGRLSLGAAASESWSIAACGLVQNTAAPHVGTRSGAFLFCATKSCFWHAVRKTPRIPPKCRRCVWPNKNKKCRSTDCPVSRLWAWRHRSVKHHSDLDKVQPQRGENDLLFTVGSPSK